MTPPAFTDLPAIDPASLTEEAPLLAPTTVAPPNEEPPPHAPERGGWWPPGTPLPLSKPVGWFAKQVRDALAVARGEGTDDDIETAFRGVASLAALLQAIGTIPPGEGSRTARAALIQGWVMDGGLDGLHAAGACGGTHATADQLLDAAVDLPEMRQTVARWQKQMPTPWDSHRPLDDYPPGLPDYLIPEGWEVDAMALMRHTGKSPDTVAESPAFPTAIASDGATTLIELMWRNVDTGKWARRWFPRGDLLTRDGARALANAGGPMFADARHLGRWVGDAHAANGGVLPVRTLARGLGWVSVGDRRALVVGERAFLDGEAIDTGGDSDVILQPDEGRAGFLDGWGKKRGTLDGWRGTVEPWLKRWPILGAAYLTSLAAPLLSRLGVAQSLVVELTGDSSTGKTTSQRVAASVWGSPENGAGPLGNWGGTGAGLERRIGALRHLPLNLNETGAGHGSAGSRTDRERRALAEAVYMLAENTGRTRATPTGLQRVDRWATTILLSGERSILADVPGAGTRARVLTLEGNPLGPRTDAMHTDAMRLERALQREYGHAGDAWGRWLSTLSSDAWRTWRERLDDLADKLGDGVTAGPGARIASAGGALLVALEMAQEAGLPVPEWREIERLILSAARGAALDADRPRAAIDAAISHVYARPGQVMQRGGGTEHNGAPETPRGGAWLAFERVDGSLAIVAEEIDKALASRGFDVPAVTRGWKARGWLVTDASRRGTKKQVRIWSGRRVACYVIPANVLDELGHGGDTDEEHPLDHGEPWGEERPCTIVSPFDEDSRNTDTPHAEDHTPHTARVVHTTHSRLPRGVNTPAATAHRTPQRGSDDGGWALTGGAIPPPDDLAPVWGGTPAE